MDDTQLTTEFLPFKKIPRLSRDIVITEKLDGTNAQILILACESLYTFRPVPGDARFTALSQDGKFAMLVGSRTRWIAPKVAGEKGDPDNYGFAAWCRDNSEELFKLGPGRHFGEWFGSGINRNYGLTERRFALFNVHRWADVRQHPLGAKFENPTQELCPACCTMVPVLYSGPFDMPQVQTSLDRLELNGSRAVPGFMNPEGIVIYHTAANALFKKTIEGDESPKGLNVG